MTEAKANKLRRKRASPAQRLFDAVHAIEDRPWNSVDEMRAALHEVLFGKSDRFRRAMAARPWELDERVQSDIPRHHPQGDY